MKQQICVIVAHPDDAELGMAGTIRRFIQCGHNVYILQTTTGEYKDLDGRIIRSRNEIYNALNKSKFWLHFNDYTILDEPTMSLECNGRTVSAVQEFIILHQITDIYTHMPIDTYHQDHINTHNIVMAAARRYVNNIYAFETIFNYTHGVLQTNCYIPLTKEQINMKLESLRCHESEYQKFGREKWLQQIQALAVYRGAQIGVKYAEAFASIKNIIPIENLDGVE